MNNIQGLWIGEKLSVMEQLSIKSFLDNGHDYHLYTYSDVEGVPDGTTIKDGNEILPESEIFTYSSGEGKGSVSAFSNFFRYKLLYDKGGWWVDTDLICIKPFDFKDDFIFSSEEHLGTVHINAGAIKAPKNSEPLKYCWETCKSKDKNLLQCGEVGPRLVAETVQVHKLENYVQDSEVFCPINFENWLQILNPNVDMKFSSNVYAIHLWNEIFRRNGMDKNKTFNSGCLYEKLKAKHLG